MSVLIKGMDMPKNDSWVNVRIKEKDGKPIIAFITGEDLEGKYFEIEEVPTPHGRLIDCERATFPTAFRYNTNDYAEGWNACIKAVQTAPTVIEAEVSEG